MEKLGEKCEIKHRSTSNCFIQKVSQSHNSQGWKGHLGVSPTRAGSPRAVCPGVPSQQRKQPLLHGWDFVPTAQRSHHNTQEI